LTVEDLAKGVILAPRNNVVNELNEALLARIDGQIHTKISRDREREYHGEQYSSEFLNSLRFAGLPPHVLRLKVGAPVMLLRNINPRVGLYNGTRLRIESIGTRTIDCVILLGPFANTVVAIPRIPLNSPVSER